jgi:uncharacterized DUF497 family protein
MTNEGILLRLKADELVGITILDASRHSVEFIVSPMAMNAVFEWDSGKTEINEQKYGISFLDAASVFDDPEALGMEYQHVREGKRELILGIDNLGRILVVVYTQRGDKIRIISARKATGKEVKEYESRI